MKKIFLLFLVLIHVGIVNAQWQPTNGPEGGSITCLSTNGNSIYAGCHGLHTSTDNGNSWTQLGLANLWINCIVFDGGNIYAGTNSGIYVSGNSGASWNSIGLASVQINAIAIMGTKILAGTYGFGIYSTTTNGIIWTQLAAGLIDDYVFSLTMSGNNIYAGTMDGIYVSHNNGINWAVSGLSNIWTTAISVSGTNIYAASHDTSGVFISTDNGVTWDSINNGLSNKMVNALAVDGTNIYAGTYGGVFLSTDNGANWITLNIGLTNTSIQALMIYGTNVFAGTNNGGVFRSSNNGQYWHSVNTGLPYSGVKTLISDSLGIYAGTSNGIHFTADSGATWTHLDTGLVNNNVSCLAKCGSNIFVGTYNDGIYLSTDNGLSWSATNTGLTDSTIDALAISGSNIFASTQSDGVFLSTNNGASWSPVNAGLPGNVQICALAISNSNIFASSCFYHQIYFSNNNGMSWTTLNTNLPSTVGQLVADGTNTYACTSNGIYVSTNNCASWSVIGPMGTNVQSFIISGTNILVSSNNHEVFITTNNGSSWAQVNSGLPADAYINDFTSVGTDVYAATNADGVWKISLGDVLVIDAGYDHTIYCGDSTHLHCSVVYPGSHPLTYTWSPASDLNSSNVTNPITHPMINNTTFHVTVTDGYHLATDSVTIYVNPLATPHISNNLNIFTSSYQNGNQWYRNDTLIPGATNQTYYGCWGKYYDIVYWNGCISDTSNIIYYGPAAINETYIVNGISVYPNPVICTIIIQIPLQSTNSELSIMNIQGQLLLKQALTQGKAVINVTGFAKGMYFVKVSGDRGVAVKKFLKN